MSTHGVRQAWLLMLLLMSTAVCLALEVPYLSGRVVDDAEILSPEARERIAELSRRHEEKTTNQIAVLTVPSLESENIEDFAVRVFENWKLGQQGRDNGVLLLIAPQERRLRIEVGYGLEGTVPDVIASRIIRDVITPHFKSGQYDAGVTQGLRALITVLEGGALPAVQETSNRKTSPWSRRPHMADMSLPKRLAACCALFSLLGIFTLGAILAPGGLGWFVYIFTMPFWAVVSLAVVSGRGALILLGVHLVGVPVTRILLSRSGWYERTYDSSTKGAAGIGGFGSGKSWSSRAWSSGSSRGSSRLRTFSGGGGRSGGGGASGRW